MSGERRAPGWFRVLAGLTLLAAFAFLIRWAWREGPRSPERNRRAAEIRLLRLRLEVLNYWDDRRRLPEVLEDTLSVRRANPPVDTFKFHRDRGQQASDAWDRPFSYTRDPDGAGFEIRSAGSDGDMNTGDDLVQRGRAGEDPKPPAAEVLGKQEEYDRLYPPTRRGRRTGF